MKSNSLKKLLMGSTLLALTGSTVAFVSPAMAQEAAASSPEVIVITGTRIQREGYTSASPVETVDADELEKQQPVDVETVLRQMPQFLPSLGSAVNNGTTGASTIDLRGLSSPRTLVLVDGTRVPGFDENGQFDVSAIPIALLKRVDVVTGGASAVYGSDAVAGVVNFILNDDFRGVQVDGNYSIDQHGTGETNAWSGTAGAGFDDGHGNVVLNVSYDNRGAVFQTIFPATLTPGASSNTNPPIFSTVGTGGSSQVQPNGTIAPSTGAGSVPLKKFDFNPFNLYQTPERRWNATALAKYNFNDHVEGYARFLYNNSSNSAIEAPSLTNNHPFEIPLTNPFLSSQESTFLAANSPGGSKACSNPALGQCVTVGTFWRSVALGPRTQIFGVDTFQAEGGVKGDFNLIGVDWKWDVAAAHGETNLRRQLKNDINNDSIQEALSTTNAASCGNGDGCVPLNFFNPSAGNFESGAALNFISLSLQKQVHTSQDYVTGSVSGDLGKLKSPLATNPIGVSLGMEYRYETADNEPDAPSIAGVSTGFGQFLPVKGSYDTTEEFVEGLIPIVEDKPFIKAINIETGFRNSNYSTSGVTHSYKYGADYSPINGLRFRGMFDRAVRAANISELFTPTTALATGDAASDPCAAGPTVVTGGLRALCIATGVPVGVLNANSLGEPNSGQITTNTSGNPNLKPEIADTWTFGGVWQPEFLHGLGITVDYYDIKIRGAIALRPAPDILSGCYDVARNPTLSATDADCSLIHRDASGDLNGGSAGDGVDQFLSNIAEVRAKGIDYTIHYNFDLPGMWGGLSVNLDGTHVNESSYVPVAGQPIIKCAGFYGKACGIPSTVTVSTGGPTPKDHFTQRTTWDVNAFNQGLEFSYLWRHLSSVDIVPSESAGADPQSRHIGAFDYVDLDAAWNITTMLKLRAGIVNVGDKKAPVVLTSTGSTPYNSGNTYPSTYDTLGRIFQVGVTAKF